MNEPGLSGVQDEVNVFYVRDWAKRHGPVVNVITTSESLADVRRKAVVLDYYPKSRYTVEDDVPDAEMARWEARPKHPFRESRYARPSAPVLEPEEIG